MKPIFTLFFLLILINNCLSQSKGGRWQFENNGYDSADWDSLDNNGVLIDLASYGQADPLQEGSSYLWLDTTRIYNYLKIGDSNDLDFSDENIGLSAWIYPIELNTTHFFINKGVQDAIPKTTNYSLRVSKTKKLEFLFHNSGGTQKVESSFTIPLNQWTFVAAYYDFGEQKVYMWDNPLTDAVDTIDFAQSFSPNDGPLAIGARYVDIVSTPSKNNFKGRIDDVRISGRMADIIPEEVDALKYLEMNTITSFQLRQNFPNPFNPRTLISFFLPQAQYVSLEIYDNRGKLVSTILEQNLSQGDHQIIWDGYQYASGIYYYQLKSAHFTQTKKMIYLK